MYTILRNFHNKNYLYKTLKKSYCGKLLKDFVNRRIVTFRDLKKSNPSKLYTCESFETYVAVEDLEGSFSAKVYTPKLTKAG